MRKWIQRIQVSVIFFFLISFEFFCDLHLRKKLLLKTWEMDLEDWQLK